MKIQKKKKKITTNSKLIYFFLFIAIVLSFGGGLFVYKLQKDKNSSFSSANNKIQVNKVEKSNWNYSSEEWENCPYLNEQEMTVLAENERTGIHKKDLEKLKQIPQDYIIKLWKKGYHCWDIFKLWDWNIEEKEVPDLKAKKRIGVIGELFVTFNLDKINNEEEETDPFDDEENIYIGGAKNLVIIVRKVSSDGQIHIDKGYFNGPMIRDEKQAGHYVKRVVNFALQQENINPGQYDIFVLSAAGRENLGQESKIGFGRIGGKSAGSALYLALLSALTQKPLSCQVAATGSLSLSTKRKKWGKVNGKNFKIVPGDNLPIGGLKHKVSACAEKEINFLVLSKYQTSPNLLSKWQREGKWRGCWDGNNNKLYTEGKWRKLAEDYQQVVPPEVREKMTVHFTENVKDLKNLLLEDKLS